ncbi:MAG: hypothetical protein WB992_17365 [Bryobacteraceae bacterium]
MGDPPRSGIAQRSRTGREIIKRFLQRAFLVLALSIAAAYACDYLVLRFRIATNGQPYGTVTVQPYYAVPQKDGKMQFLVDAPQDETCVHALFPHMGDSPCWYLSRHKEKRISL